MDLKQVKDLYGEIVTVKLKKDNEWVQGVLAYYNFDTETITLNDVTITSKTYTTFKKVMLINRMDWTRLSLGGEKNERRH